MRICTDLDGTLLDNRCAVERAYRVVGAPDPMFGYPGGEELAPYRAKKNAIYPNMLRKYARPLPLNHLLLYLVRVTGMTVHILTSASTEGARCSLDFLGWPPADCPQVQLYTALTLEQRIATLYGLGRGIYFDDSEGNLNQIYNNLGKSWQLCTAWS